MYKCEGCNQHYPLFLGMHKSPVRKRQDSSEKKREQRRKIEEDSNEKLQKMTEIIFSNNDSLKRNYEKFMRYQHDYFMSVGAAVTQGEGPVRPEAPVQGQESTRGRHADGGGIQRCVAD